MASKLIEVKEALEERLHFMRNDIDITSDVNLGLVLISHSSGVESIIEVGENVDINEMMEHFISNFLDSIDYIQRNSHKLQTPLKKENVFPMLFAVDKEMKEVISYPFAGELHIVFCDTKGELHSDELLIMTQHSLQQEREFITKNNIFSIAIENMKNQGWKQPHNRLRAELMDNEIIELEIYRGPMHQGQFIVSDLTKENISSTFYATFPNPYISIVIKAIPSIPEDDYYNFALSLITADIMAHMGENDFNLEVYKFTHGFPKLI